MKKITLNPVLENLMEQIFDERNMERAWKKVKANRGAPGPDGVTLEEFFLTFRDQWPTVRQQLLNGTYEPSPARRKPIPKPDGSERDLGIPNVQERLVQQAILQVLTPIFDPGFTHRHRQPSPGRSNCVPGRWTARRPFDLSCYSPATSRPPRSCVGRRVVQNDLALELFLGRTFLLGEAPRAKHVTSCAVQSRRFVRVS